MTVTKNNSVFYNLIIALLLLTPISSQAETVLVHSKIQAKGQGWLFGSPTDASCWIAVPKHVVEIKKNGSVAEFHWSDKKGHEGRGIEVFVPEKDIDLAFAKATGKAKGDCLSRLGAQDLSFTVSRQLEVEAMVMQKTFTSPKKMEIRDFDNKYFHFSPVDEAAQEAMQPGLSGAPLMLRSKNTSDDKPMGLICNINKKEQTGYALRFDKIRTLFLESANKQPASNAAKKDASDIPAFNLINATGISHSTDTTADYALIDKGCWVAKPPAGKKNFEVMLKFANQQNVFSGLSLRFDRKCGQQPDAIMLEHKQGQHWSHLTDCRFSSEEAATCVTAKRKLHELRLKVIKRDGGEIAIAKIELIN